MDFRWQVDSDIRFHCRHPFLSTYTDNRQRYADNIYFCEMARSLSEIVWHKKYGITCVAKYLFLL